MTGLTGIPIEIAINDPQWSKLELDLEALSRAAIKAGADVLDKLRQGELSLAFVSDIDIHALNKTWRSKDKPTNVLSFPAGGPVPLLGDIVLARETIIREADERGLEIRDHLTHLLIHGFLHLQGYDHIEDEDAETMEALEIQALKTLNIDNPYEINDRRVAQTSV